MSDPGRGDWQRLAEVLATAARAWWENTGRHEAPRPRLSRESVNAELGRKPAPSVKGAKRRGAA